MRLHEAQPQDESTHIALAADGDGTAREWLVRRWTPPVYRFSLRMLSNEQDAYDAAQDTMVKVLNNLHRYDRNRAFSTWVFGIARNTCIDEHRKRRRRGDMPSTEVVDTGPTPLQEVARHLRAERVHEALAELPPMYREVLIMYHFEHLKYAEIAEALELPMGTVMNRIFRARQKLRDLYGTNDLPA
ncbi:MAG: sigma-70 family RNA polymerase sigma factor [Alphaproteobacteria bacterium]|nr:sigma-70 family RNA polymerase sigma factor [Alphaproteobacteria bacterium]